jgi:hypothetical protein
MTKEKLKRFAVTYEINYVHRVVVGITATEAESAKQLVETAFNESTIWDDTKEMPLLFDDYEEEEGETLRFSAEEVLDFPEPDSSVRAIKQKESAFHACRMLLDGKTELARNFAEQALPHLSGQDALSAKSSAQKNPIAQVTLSGGVWKDSGEEGGVDVEVFDFDNYYDSPADFKASLPAHFNGLAEQLGIPGDVIAQADQEFECKSCGRVYDDCQECLSDDCPSKTALLTSSEILELAKNHNLQFSLLQDGDFRGTHYLHFGYDHIYFYKDRDRDHEVTEIRAEDFLYVHPDSLGKVWRIDQPIGDKISMNSRLWKLRDALEQVRAALPDICFAKNEGIDPDLIMHINSVLNSEDNLEEFKRVLIEAKNALPTAWANHGGVAGELLQLIDLAIRM